MRSLSQAHVDQIVSRARALGDATRVRILGLLSRGEQPAGHIAQALAMQQSTVSKHLQVLFNAGLVQRRREASAVIYSTHASGTHKLLGFLGRRALGGALSSSRMKSKRAPKAIRAPRRRLNP